MSSWRNRGVAIIGAVLAGALGACGPAGEDEAQSTAGEERVASAAIPPTHCLYNITNFSGAGPFTYTTRTVNLAVKMWIPNVPAGCKIPVVHFANGTGARCSTYATVLQRLASHGFFAVCYESTNTGAGDQGVTAIQTAMQAYPNLIDARIGSTGHSQGGQAAFVVLAKAEQQFASLSPVLAGLAIEPASGYGAQPVGGWQTWYARIRSPMFMFSGLGTDGLVSQSWVQLGFNALSDGTEAYFWAASGATHVPPPNGLTNQVAIPWFRWKLLGDPNACRAFQALATTSPWRTIDVQNAQACN